MNFDRKGGQVGSAAHAGFARSRWVHLVIYFFTVAGLADLALRPGHCPGPCQVPAFLSLFSARAHIQLFSFIQRVNFDRKGGQVEVAANLPGL